jgi:hypothetical protein
LLDDDGDDYDEKKLRPDGLIDEASLIQHVIISSAQFPRNATLIFNQHDNVWRRIAFHSENWYCVIAILSWREGPMSPKSKPKQHKFYAIFTLNTAGWRGGRWVPTTHIAIYPKDGHNIVSPGFVLFPLRCGFDANECQ